MRILILLPVFLFAFTFLSAQEGTTLEEYRYCSKGYGYQKGMGLDATKEGYYFKPLYTSPTQIEFVGMYRNGNTAPQAILCIFDKGISENSFLCLPNNQASKDIVTLYENDLNGRLNTEKRRDFNQAMRELLFIQLGSPNMTAAKAPVTGNIPSEEVLTARGINPQPVVAAATTTPKTPQTDKVASVPNEPIPEEMSFTQKSVDPVAKANDPWGGLPINSTNPATPSNFDYVPAQKTVPSATQPEVITGSATINTNFNLDNRQIVTQPSLIYNTQKRGVVVVKLCVANNGQVTSSKFTQRGSTTLNVELIQLAENHAAKIRFADSPIPEQCGTITYTFNL